MKYVVCALALAAVAVTACASRNTAPEVARIPTGDRDTCGASAFATLVDKPTSAINPDVLPANRRIYSTKQPVTMDLSPTRLNVIYDVQEFKVVELRCG